MALAYLFDFAQSRQIFEQLDLDFSAGVDNSEGGEDQSDLERDLVEDNIKPLQTQDYKEPDIICTPTLIE